jgi:hypothetical protein
MDRRRLTSTGEATSRGRSDNAVAPAAKSLEDITSGDELNEAPRDVSRRPANLVGQGRLATVSESRREDVSPRESSNVPRSPDALTDHAGGSDRFVDLDRLGLQGSDTSHSSQRRPPFSELSDHGPTRPLVAVRSDRSRIAQQAASHAMSSDKSSSSSEALLAQKVSSNDTSSGKVPSSNEGTLGTGGAGESVMHSVRRSSRSSSRLSARGLRVATGSPEAVPRRSVAGGEHPSTAPAAERFWKPSPNEPARDDSGAGSNSSKTSARPEHPAMLARQNRQSTSNAISNSIVGINSRRTSLTRSQSAKYRSGSNLLGSMHSKPKSSGISSRSLDESELFTSGRTGSRPVFASGTSHVASCCFVRVASAHIDAEFQQYSMRWLGKNSWLVFLLVLGAMTANELFSAILMYGWSVSPDLKERVERGGVFPGRFSDTLATFVLYAAQVICLLAFPPQTPAACGRMKKCHRRSEGCNAAWNSYGGGLIGLFLVLDSIALFARQVARQPTTESVASWQLWLAPVSYMLAALGLVLRLPLRMFFASLTVSLTLVAFATCFYVTKFQQGDLSVWGFPNDYGVPRIFGAALISWFIAAMITWGRAFMATRLFLADRLLGRENRKVRLVLANPISGFAGRLARSLHLERSSKYPWLLFPDELHVGRVLGRGTDAVVYAGSLYGWPVVIKRHHGCLQTEEAVREFIRGMDMLIQLSSPNVVRVIGASVVSDPKLDLFSGQARRKMFQQLLGQYHSSGTVGAVDIPATHSPGTAENMILLQNDTGQRGALGQVLKGASQSSRALLDGSTSKGKLAPSTERVRRSSLPGIHLAGTHQAHQASALMPSSVLNALRGSVPRIQESALAKELVGCSVVIVMDWLSLGPLSDFIDASCLMAGQLQPPDSQVPSDRSDKEDSSDQLRDAGHEEGGPQPGERALSPTRSSDASRAVGIRSGSPDVEQDSRGEDSTKEASQRSIQSNAEPARAATAAAAPQEDASPVDAVALARAGSDAIRNIPSSNSSHHGGRGSQVIAAKPALHEPSPMLQPRRSVLRSKRSQRNLENAAPSAVKPAIRRTSDARSSKILAGESGGIFESAREDGGDRPPSGDTSAAAMPGGGDHARANDRRIRMPWGVRIRILQQIAAGCKHLHSFEPPVVHGDLRPSNINLHGDPLKPLACVGDLATPGFTTEEEWQESVSQQRRAREQPTPGRRGSLRGTFAALSVRLGLSSGDVLHQGGSPPRGRAYSTEVRESKSPPVSRRAKSTRGLPTTTQPRVGDMTDQLSTAGGGILRDSAPHVEIPAKTVVISSHLRSQTAVPSVLSGTTSSRPPHVGDQFDNSTSELTGEQSLERHPVRSSSVLHDAHDTTLQPARSVRSQTVADYRRPVRTPTSKMHVSKHSSSAFSFSGLTLGSQFDTDLSAGLQRVSQLPKLGVGLLGSLLQSDQSGLHDISHADSAMSVGFPGAGNAGRQAGARAFSQAANGPTLSQAARKSGQQRGELAPLAYYTQPAYMAPELFEFRAKPTPASDVYAFAMVAYELVTGKKPFVGEMDDRVAYMIAVDGARPPIGNAARELLFIRDSNGQLTLTDLTAAEASAIELQGVLEQLVVRCWDDNPNSRPTFSAICDALAEIKDRYNNSLLRQHEDLEAAMAVSGQYAWLDTGKLGAAVELRPTALLQIGAMLMAQMANADGVQIPGQSRIDMSAIGGQRSALDALTAAQQLKSQTSQKAAAERGKSLLPEDSVIQSMSGTTTRIPMEHVTLEKEIGAGAFGRVYRGRIHGALVAIKTFDFSKKAETMTKVFRREVGVLSTIRHPCVLAFIGVVVDSRLTAIVTEFCSRGSLQAIVSASRRSAERRVAQQEQLPAKSGGFTPSGAAAAAHRVPSSNTLQSPSKSVVSPQDSAPKISSKKTVMPTVSRRALGMDSWSALQRPDSLQRSGTRPTTPTGWDMSRQPSMQSLTNQSALSVPGLDAHVGPGLEVASLRRRISWLLSAARGLMYLHKLQAGVTVVHRDIKADNVLITAALEAKLADFGFARVTAPEMSRCGTLAYTAPEVLTGSTYDERSDIYSFGVVICEVLSGHKPYQDWKRQALEVSSKQVETAMQTSKQAKVKASRRRAARITRDLMVNVVQGRVRPSIDLEPGLDVDVPGEFEIPLADGELPLLLPLQRAEDSLAHVAMLGARNIPVPPSKPQPSAKWRCFALAALARACWATNASRRPRVSRIVETIEQLMLRLPDRYEPGCDPVDWSLRQLEIFGTSAEHVRAAAVTANQTSGEDSAPRSSVPEKDATKASAQQAVPRAISFQAGGELVASSAPHRAGPSEESEDPPSSAGRGRIVQQRTPSTSPIRLRRLDGSQVVHHGPLGQITEVGGTMTDDTGSGPNPSRSESSNIFSLFAGEQYALDTPKDSEASIEERSRRSARVPRVQSTPEWIARQVDSHKAEGKRRARRRTRSNPSLHEPLLHEELRQRLVAQDPPTESDTTSLQVQGRGPVSRPRGGGMPVASGADAGEGTRHIAKEDMSPETRLRTFGDREARPLEGSKPVVASSRSLKRRASSDNVGRTLRNRQQSSTEDSSSGANPASKSVNLENHSPDFSAHGTPGSEGGGAPMSVGPISSTGFIPRPSGAPLLNVRSSSGSEVVSTPPVSKPPRSSVTVYQGPATVRDLLVRPGLRETRAGKRSEERGEQLRSFQEPPSRGVPFPGEWLAFVQLTSSLLSSLLSHAASKATAPGAMLNTDQASPSAHPRMFSAATQRIYVVLHGAPLADAKHQFLAWATQNKGRRISSFLFVPATALCAPAGSDIACFDTPGFAAAAPGTTFVAQVDDKGPPPASPASSTHHSAAAAHRLSHSPGGSPGKLQQQPLVLITADTLVSPAAVAAWVMQVTQAVNWSPPTPLLTFLFLSRLAVATQLRFYPSPVNWRRVTLACMTLAQHCIARDPLRLAFRVRAPGKAVLASALGMGVDDHFSASISPTMLQERRLSEPSPSDRSRPDSERSPAKPASPSDVTDITSGVSRPKGLRIGTLASSTSGEQSEGLPALPELAETPTSEAMANFSSSDHSGKDSSAGTGLEDDITDVQPALPVAVANGRKRIFRFDDTQTHVTERQDPSSSTASTPSNSHAETPKASEPAVMHTSTTASSPSSLRERVGIPASSPVSSSSNDGGRRRAANATISFEAQELSRLSRIVATYLRFKLSVTMKPLMGVRKEFENVCKANQAKLVEQWTDTDEEVPKDLMRRVQLSEFGAVQQKIILDGTKKSQAVFMKTVGRRGSSGGGGKEAASDSADKASAAASKTAGTSRKQWDGISSSSAWLPLLLSSHADKERGGSRSEEDAVTGFLEQTE